MPDDTLTTTLAATVSLAWAAADEALRHYRPGIAVDIKNNDPDNLVTQADRDVNALIIAALERRYPGDAILAEEAQATHAYAQRRHNRRLWCIDPIDGTREFVARSGDFAVMIGLAIDGAARLGVVLQPTQERVYAGALLEDGSTEAWTAGRDGHKEPLRVNQVADSAQGRLMVSRSFRSRGIVKLGQLLGAQELVPMGSVGLKMAMLARGSAEMYVSLSTQTHEWDACGPEAILRAAGGTVTCLDGRQLVYNKPTTPTPRGIVASNGPLHPQCLQAVATLEELRRRG